MNENRSGLYILISGFALFVTAHTMQLSVASLIGGATSIVQQLLDKCRARQGVGVRPGSPAPDSGCSSDPARA